MLLEIFLKFNIKIILIILDTLKTALHVMSIGKICSNIYKDSIKSNMQSKHKGSSVIKHFNVPINQMFLNRQKYISKK